MALQKIETVLDNLQHCLKTVFSVARFSDSRLLNNFFTRLSTYFFVGTRFAPFRFWCQIALVVVATLTTAYKVCGANLPLGWIIPSLTGLFSFLAYLNNFWHFHRVEKLGPDVATTNRLSRAFASKKKFLIPERFHFQNIKARNDLVPVESISLGSTQTAYEFDLRISEHLLTNPIDFAIEEYPGPATEKEIVRNSATHHHNMLKAFQIKRRQMLMNGKSFFNAEKVSLRKIEFTTHGDESRLTGTVSTTSYYLSAMTNDVAADCFTDISGYLTNHELFDLQPMARSDGGLFTATALSEDSPLSNHIGSVVLAVSADGYPVLCRQGDNAVISAGKFVLSGSGSLELSDIKNARAKKSNPYPTMSSFIKFGMARELLEETGGIPQESHRKCDLAHIREFSSSIQLVGFYRDFNRGGQPIFLGFAKLEETHAQLVNRKRPSVCLIGSPMETMVIKIKHVKAVTCASGMIAALNIYIKNDGTELNDRTPSDQVLIVRELIQKHQVVRDHLNKLLGRPPTH